MAPSPHITAPPPARSPPVGKVATLNTTDNSYELYDLLQEAPSNAAVMIRAIFSGLNGYVNCGKKCQLHYVLLYPMLPAILYTASQAIPFLNYPCHHTYCQKNYSLYQLSLPSYTPLPNYPCHITKCQQSCLPSQLFLPAELLPSTNHAIQHIASRPVLFTTISPTPHSASRPVLFPTISPTPHSASRPVLFRTIPPTLHSVINRHVLFPSIPPTLHSASRPVLLPTILPTLHSASRLVLFPTILSTLHSVSRPALFPTIPPTLHSVISRPVLFPSIPATLHSGSKPVFFQISLQPYMYNWIKSGTNLNFFTWDVYICN
ncbi:hypothetical protein XELAEV_18028719mg [Xenopus laevis]|uniref:Uncharacterized protein n=1 Tax=Xenopus laevis TaxID=8355 RepID=A0A974CS37_XENLA|nr:hypothetical protein XELAEV_18028719mg [Xenopus laevis]